jgi:hypothetical protein
MDNVSDKEQLMIALVHGDDILRYAEESGVHRTGLESGQAIACERDDRHIASPPAFGTTRSLMIVVAKR